MFREERDQSQFEWSMLGDLKEGGPNLGPMTHVAVYRLDACSVTGSGTPTKPFFPVESCMATATN